MRYTTNHEFIREWIEAFGGLPAIRVGSRAPDDSRIEVSWNRNNPDISPITWNEFFEWFEAENLAFGYPDEEATVDPRYSEFADRDDVPLTHHVMHAEEHNFDKYDPFEQKREWLYDKPHRE